MSGNGTLSNFLVNLSDANLVRNFFWLTLKLKNMKALILTLVLLAAAPGWTQSFENSEITANMLRSVLTGPQMASLEVEEIFRKTPGLDCIERLKWRKKSNDRHCDPQPPQLPRNFRIKGRYIVPDLVDPTTGQVGVDVPFTWNGKDGNLQMIAGSEDHPIYFTNLIFDNHLYTYTYKWPGLQPEFLPPLEPCEPLLEFSLHDLNAFFATSHYVGAEILEEKPPRHVHHFRLSLALPPLPPGFYPRLPILSADIYVDQKDSSKFWKVLHFGLQNLYDPNLDEWIVLNKFEHCPGEVELPAACMQRPCCRP